MLTAPASSSLLRRELHRRDAVPDVEIRLLLPAVAEHAQPRRILAQAPTEVEDVPVRVALAEDRDEAEDRARRSRSRARTPGSAPRPRASTRRRARSAPGTGTSRAWGRPRARRRPSRWTRTRCASTPAARIASSTLEVAIVFCSRSRAGWSSPRRTSAFAARWKTVSQPSSDAPEHAPRRARRPARTRLPAGRTRRR